MPGRPDRARFFPKTSWAALQAGETVPYVTAAAIATLDPNGSGRVVLDKARQHVADWRGISRRAILRNFSEAEELGYWRTYKRRDGEFLSLTSIARIMLKFGIESERAPRLVPLDSITTPGKMRAALFACAYELPDHSGRFKNGPLSRATKRDLTGVPETTQRRYDKVATELIETPVVAVDSTDGIRLQGRDLFIGRDGRQYRRLADYRMPIGVSAASKTAARHALVKVRQLRNEGSVELGIEPLVEFRGSTGAEPDLPNRQRRFYPALTEAAALERARRAHARGRASGRVVIAWGYDPDDMQYREIEL